MNEISDTTKSQFQISIRK